MTQQTHTPKPSKLAHAAICVCTERDITDFCTDDHDIIATIYVRYTQLYPNSLVATAPRRGRAVAKSLSMSPYFLRTRERRPGGEGRKYYRSRYALSAEGLGNLENLAVLEHRPAYIDRCIEIYRLSYNLEAIHISNPDHMLGIWQLVHNSREPHLVNLTVKQARAEIADHIRGIG